jgi:ATP-dependent DNA helicase RecQ
VLALTATAAPRVVRDVCERLRGEGREPFAVFRMSFERSNLAYIVRHCPDKEAELVATLRRTPGSAIVYVRSRRHAADLARLLSEQGLSATFYHAGLEHTLKDSRQDAWQRGESRIIVATNAFGMGIDKPDVRLVMHYDCPDSPEAYFQEAGRAGRDGRPARAVLLFNRSDRAKLERRVDETFPPKDYVRQVYEHLAYYYQIAAGDGYGVSREFNIEDFCLRFRHFPVAVHSSLLLLSRAGYIDYDEETDNEARLRFLVGRDDLYRLRQLSESEDKVIVALLRSYGGLFADYGFISEDTVARQAGLSQQQTYDILTSLSRRHLLDFIPRKRVPYIRYLQRREDAAHLRLPPEVYDDRRLQYQARISEMIRYAESCDCCRSRLLLAYFGETASSDCGQCDVCREQSSPDAAPEDDDRQVRQAILDLLADRQRHHVTELLQLPFDSRQTEQALSRLVEEESVLQEDGCLMRRA